MKKLKLQAQMTVDGFIAGKHGEMDWLSDNWTDDIKNYVNNLVQSKWENTEIENGDFIEKNKALKQQPGKNMIVYGGGKFVLSLIRKKLIDELPLL